MQNPQIFRLAPAYKDYLWGGAKLKERYGKHSALNIVAESWEFSAHKNGESTAASGAFSGMTLSEIFRTHKALFGTKCANLSAVPILIKLIDAKQPLSIQVHPSRELANAGEGEAEKNEMWIVLESEPGAFLYMSFAKPLSKTDFESHIKDGTLPDVLDKKPVQKGDVFFIPAGTIHAIGAGIVLAEVQQNSDTTYRVYDYGRLSAAGVPRQLHIEKALQVTQLAPANPHAPGKTAPRAQHGGSTETLASCEYFTVDRITLDGEIPLNATSESFTALLWASGNGTISCCNESFSAHQGECFFVPAGHFSYTISGNGSVLLSKV